MGLGAWAWECCSLSLEQRRSIIYPNRRAMLDERIVFKVIMLGATGVGKSSMLIRYIKGSFSEQYHVTVGVEFATKNVKIDDKKEVKLQIWDTAGQEAFKAIVRTFYKGIAGVFLAFSIIKEDTLEALHSWLQEVREHGHEEVVFFLVGTKADLEDERQVTAEMVEKYLKQIGAVFYIETSSKYGTGIEEVDGFVSQLFTKAGQFMYKKYITNGSFRNLVRPVMASGIDFRTESFDLNAGKAPEGKKCCK